MDWWKNPKISRVFNIKVNVALLSDWLLSRNLWMYHEVKLLIMTRRMIRSCYYELL